MNEVEQIEKELSKEYGNVIIDADFIMDNPKKVVSVSPAIDMGLHGGIPEGSWVILSGPPKCGKTTTALQIARNAQHQYNKFVYYLSVEGRFKEMNLKGVEGFKYEDFKLITSIKGKILLAEDFLSIAMKLIKVHPGCVIIIDSSSSLCSGKEFEEDITAQTRQLGPKLLSSFCRQMGTVVPVQDTIVIIIQHLITNTGGYGPKYMEDGGVKVQFQGDVKMRCRGFSKWEERENYIGQIVEWEVLAAALGPPGNRIQSYLRFGKGIDKVMELINIACDLGIIAKAGAWYSFAEGDDTKFQGQEKLHAFLSENPLIYDKLEKQVKDMTDA